MDTILKLPGLQILDELARLDADFGCVPRKVPGVECLLMPEQHVMHGPELAMSSGNLRRLSCHHRVRVNFAKREMAVDKAQPVAKVATHSLDNGMCAATVRAFKIAVFHQRDGGRIGTLAMVVD